MSRKHPVRTPTHDLDRVRRCGTLNARARLAQTPEPLRGRGAFRGLAALGILAIAAGTWAGCAASGSKRCTEKTGNSFRTFLDDEWTNYCESYTKHTEQPSEFTLRELVTFLGEHPAKAKELQEKLYRHQDYETCFDTSKEELRLRNLETCLTYDEKQQLEVINAWEVAVEPWIEETGFGLQAVETKLIETEKNAKRLSMKSNDHYASKKAVPEETLEDFEQMKVQLEELDTAVAAMENAGGRFEDLVAAAKGNPPLLEAMNEGQAPKINALAADIADARARIGQVKLTAGYLDYAFRGVGVECPTGNEKAKKEKKIAEDVVGSKVKEVGGKELNIATTIKTDKNGTTPVERFTGFVCGVRSKEHQFPEMPQQCGQYQFVIERQKTGDAWGSWALKTFQESGPSGGVDCEKLEGKPKPKVIRPKKEGGVVF